MSGHVIQVKTSDGEINSYIKELWPLIQGREMALVSPSLIMILLSIQDPEMDQDTLLRGVKDVSGYIATYLSTTDETVN